MQVSRSTVWRLARAGKIPYVDVGDRRLRFKFDAVVEALTKTDPKPKPTND